MAKDVILNKVAIIERCLKRIKEEYAGNPDNLTNLTKQDSIVLNIQRACEASIDLAMHLVSENALGIPQGSRDAFEFLGDANIIDKSLAMKMKAMVGFRNIAVHDYQALNLDIIRKVIDYHLDDLLKFTKVIVGYTQGKTTRQNN